MQRSELEHLIRASGEIAQDDEIIIIGSQAILGQYPDAPARLLVSINNENTNGITGLCLEVHDLTVSKLIAGRTKDLEFVQELVKHQMVDQITLYERLEMTDISNAGRRLATSRVRALFGR